MRTSIVSTLLGIPVWGNRSHPSVLTGTEGSYDSKNYVLGQGTPTLLRPSLQSGMPLLEFVLGTAWVGAEVMVRAKVGLTTREATRRVEDA